MPPPPTLETAEGPALNRVNCFKYFDQFVAEVMKKMSLPDATCDVVTSKGAFCLVLDL